MRLRAYPRSNESPQDPFSFASLIARSVGFLSSVNTDREFCCQSRSRLYYCTLASKTPVSTVLPCFI